MRIERARCLFHILGAAVFVPLVGCASAVRISDLEADEVLEIGLDANARAHEPGRQIKFYVDVKNCCDL